MLILDRSLRLVALVAFMVLLVAVLSGCASPAPAPALQPSPSPRAGLGEPGGVIALHASGAALDAIALATVPTLRGEERPTGATSFEPTLGVDPKGAIYMAARFDGTIGERVRGSFDQGVTWRDVNPVLAAGVTNPPESSDPFLYVDPVAGRVFEVGLQGEACSWVVFSDDQGKSWTTNPADCGVPFTGDDHQSVVAAPSRGSTTSYGGGRMVYYCSQNNLFVNCASSTNGGLTFGMRVPVFIGGRSETPAACTAATGHLRADHAGRVFLSQVHCGTPVAVVSEDEGRTWTTHVISESVRGDGYHMDLAADDADNLYALWISDKGLPTLSRSLDHGTTWDAPWTVSSPSITAAQFPVLEAGGPGRIVFGYYGTDHAVAAGGATDWTGAVWHAYLGVSLDALAPDPVLATTTIDSTADPIARGDCTGRCGGAGDFLDIALDPQGRPWMAITDVCHSACLSGAPSDAGPDHGAVGTLAIGPSLLAAGGPLPALPPLSGPG